MTTPAEPDEEVKKLLEAAEQFLPFKPYVLYSQNRDDLRVYLENDSDYAAEVPGNPGLTTIRAFSDKRITGLCIHGISQYVRPLIEQRDKRIRELETWKAGAAQLHKDDLEIIQRLQARIKELEGRDG